MAGGHRRLAAVAVLLATLWPAAAVAAPDAVDRIGGDDRIDTAVRVSQEFFPAAGAVVLARADTFPDALAAGPLAGFADAPILLTPSRRLDARVAAEIRRLGAQRVYVIGSTAALSAAVAEQAAELAPVTRLQGRNRYATAEAVASEIATYRETGLAFSFGAVVDGAAFPDALSAINSGPDFIRLTPTASLPGDSRVCDPSYPDFCIEAPPPDLNCGDLPFVNGPAENGEGFAVTGDDPHGFDTDGDGVGCERYLTNPAEEILVVVGDESAVSGNVERQLGYGPDTVIRVAGENRYRTNARTLERALELRGRDDDLGPGPQGPLFVATGETFPDALAGGAAVVQTGGYLALVQPDRVPAAVAQVLEANADAFTRVVVLGGPPAVEDAVVEELRGLLGVG